MSEIFVFLAIAGAFLCFSLFVFREKEFFAGCILIALSGTFFYLAANSAEHHYGPLIVEDLDNRTFIVEQKGIGVELKPFYVVYDISAKKNRLALWDTYPPQGYNEVKTEDGKLLLSPIPGK